MSKNWLFWNAKCLNLIVSIRIALAQPWRTRYASSTRSPQICLSVSCISCDIRNCSLFLPRFALEWVRTEDEISGGEKWRAQENHKHNKANELLFAIEKIRNKLKFRAFYDWFMWFLNFIKYTITFGYDVWARISEFYLFIIIIQGIQLFYLGRYR